MLVVENTIITENLFQITLDAEAVASSFKIPGQYVIITLENQKPLYLVIASSVGATKWTFLIRDTNPSTKALKESKVGGKLNVSGPQGNGYPMSKLLGQNIVLFSAGTGLASFYSVISEIINHRDEYQKVVLLHGSRLEAELPFKEEMLNWVRNDIEVFVTLSKPTDSWAFHEGRVQDILRHEKIDLTEFKSLVCGPSQMTRDVAIVAGEFGLNQANIFTNF